VLTKKNEGLFAKKIARKSRNSQSMSGGGVGALGKLMHDPNVPSPATKYKCSSIIFNIVAIAHSVPNLGTRLL